MKKKIFYIFHIHYYLTFFTKIAKFIIIYIKRFKINLKFLKLREKIKLLLKIFLKNNENNISFCKIKL